MSVSSSPDTLAQRLAGLLAQCALKNQRYFHDWVPVWHRGGILVRAVRSADLARSIKVSKLTAKTPRKPRPPVSRQPSVVTRLFDPHP
jgi:hypothetical protein